MCVGPTQHALAESNSNLRLHHPEPLRILWSRRADVLEPGGEAVGRSAHQVLPEAPAHLAAIKAIPTRGTFHFPQR